MLTVLLYSLSPPYLYYFPLLLDTQYIMNIFLVTFYLYSTISIISTLKNQAIIYLIFYLFSTYMNHKTINRFLYYTITVFINLLNSNRSNSQARPNKG